MPTLLLLTSPPTVQTPQASSTHSGSSCGLYKPARLALTYHAISSVCLSEVDYLLRYSLSQLHPLPNTRSICVVYTYLPSFPPFVRVHSFLYPVLPSFVPPTFFLFTAARVDRGILPVDPSTADTTVNLSK